VGDDSFNVVTAVSGTAVSLLYPTTVAGSSVTLTFGGSAPPPIRFVQTAAYGSIGSGTRSYIRESITPTDIDFWQFIPAAGTGAAAQVSNFNIEDTGIKFGVPVNVTAGPVIFSGTGNTSDYNNAEIVLGGPNSPDNTYRPIIMVNTSDPSLSPLTCLEFASGTTANPVARFRLFDVHLNGDGTDHFALQDDIHGQQLLNINSVSSGASTFTFSGSGSFSGAFAAPSLTDSGLSTGQFVVAGSPFTGLTPGTGVATAMGNAANTSGGLVTQSAADSRYQASGAYQKVGVTSYSPTGASPTVTVDLSLGNCFVVDLTGASGTPVIAFSHAVAGSSCLLKMIQGTTAINCTFPRPGAAAQLIRRAARARSMRSRCSSPTAHTT